MPISPDRLNKRDKGNNSSGVEQGRHFSAELLEPSDGDVMHALMDSYFEVRANDSLGVFLTPTSYDDIDTQPEINLPAISRARLNQLITGLAVIGSLGMASALTIQNRGMDKGSAETISTAQAISSINYIERESAIEVDINAGEYSIFIQDYNKPHNWDIELPAREDAWYVPDNTTFQMYKDVFDLQYSQSLIDVPALVGTPSGGFEPRIMEPGEYPSYAGMYGNMEFGNPDFVQTQMMEEWSSAAERFGWNDLDSLEAFEGLTTYQWMVLLQTPASEFDYDTRLASGYADYDPELTSSHVNLTIEELMIERKGVCRDIERVNISSWVVANEMFDLADRGLLYVPVAQASDAKHTRGMFVLAKPDNSVDVIGVDTTNSRSDVSNSLIDSDPQSVLAWHTQQFGKEHFKSPADSILFYETILAEYGHDMNSVPRAIVDRELLYAYAKHAEESTNNKTHTERNQEAFDFLSKQLRRESIEEVDILSRPIRVIRLYEVLVRLGIRLDEYQKGNENELIARQEFSHYLERNGIDNPSEVEEYAQVIDKLGSEQRDGVLMRLSDKVTEYRERQSF
ncbi:MAG: hypothetical protein Q8P90_05675 [bacterium]|nr:hypothetical protein [bacterium]